jgi:hypothetical protein
MISVKRIKFSLQDTRLTDGHSQIKLPPPTRFGRRFWSWSLTLSPRMSSSSLIALWLPGSFLQLTMMRSSPQWSRRRGSTSPIRVCIDQSRTWRWSLSFSNVSLLRSSFAIPWIADLLPPLQSGFQPRHSTETAILDVLSDILAAVDRGNDAALALLDLSAAVDMVDHDCLIQHLQISYGINGNVLWWFRSNLGGYIRMVFSPIVAVYCGWRYNSISVHQIHSRTARWIRINSVRKQMMWETHYYAGLCLLYCIACSHFEGVADIPFAHSDKTDMSCNAQKPLCMVFNHRNHNKIVSSVSKFYTSLFEQQFL